MKVHPWSLAVVLSLGVSSAWLSTASAQPAFPGQAGVEVLPRGPVHEAYAGPVAGQPQPTPLAPRQPPPPIEELPADQRPEGDNVQWVPGYWGWDDDRDDFVWVSGFWRVPPPQRQWLPGRWQQAQGGWQWVSGLWALEQQAQLTYLPPPPDLLQTAAPGPAPGPDSFFVGGTWVWTAGRYAWRPGCWVTFRPGWVWVPAHYLWTPCGYVFVDGYWDYPLQQRGLLFAPVSIAVAAYTRPAFYYRPCYAVPHDCLYGALFARPSCGHYYFGDYFGARYQRQGFTPWCDYKVAPHCRDPLFNYYSCHHREHRGWENRLRTLYTARASGEAPRPPRTLAQQNALAQNSPANAGNLAMVSPLTQLSRSGAKLQPVTADQQQAQQFSLRQLQQAGVQRRQAEARALAQGPAPARPTDAPRVVSVNLPKQPLLLGTKSTQAPPPAPVQTAVQPALPLTTRPAPSQQPPVVLPGKVGTPPVAVTPKLPLLQPAAPVRPAQPVKTAPAPQPAPQPAQARPIIRSEPPAKSGR